MKVQCDVCEKAEAMLLCCADEAALCWNCDKAVHSANKLAQKHQRLPLFFAPTTSPSSSNSLSAPNTSSNHVMPTCDVCQEKAGYFFCVQDRTLLCRNCDVSVHQMNRFRTSHKRFIITGVKVGLQHYVSTETNNSSTTNEGEVISEEWMWNEVFNCAEYSQCYGHSEPGSSS